MRDDEDRTTGGRLFQAPVISVIIKAKFHYASWFEAGSELVRSWSPISFEPVCDQLRTSFEPASVMELGFYRALLVRCMTVRPDDTFRMK